MTFLPSVINFSVFPASVVALCLSFPLFLIVAVLLYLLSMVVNDGALRLCEVENSLLAPLGKECHSNHLLLCRKRPCNNESWHPQVYLSHFLDSKIVK